MNRLLLTIGAILAVAPLQGPLAQQPVRPRDPKLMRLSLQPTPSIPVEVRTIVYRAADGTELPADFYYDPRRTDARPALVFVSGTSDSRAWGTYRDLGHLAAQSGFIGVVPAKRFGRQPIEVEAGVRDTKALLQQLGKLAPGIVDPGRICMWAFSAGGVALSLSFDLTAPRMSCAIGYYPVLSSPTVGRDAETPKPTESPIDLLGRYGNAESPPLLVVRAGRDSTAINQDIAAFSSLAIERNAPLTLFNLPLAQHGFDTLDHVEWSRSMVQQTFDFVRAAVSTPERSASEN